MKRKWKFFWSFIIVLIIAGVILFQNRRAIVGQYVPDVTKVYYANFNWETDSLKGIVAVGIKNKSITTIVIDSVSLILDMGGNNFLDFHQKTGIRLTALDEDTLRLGINFPIKKFIAFLDSLKETDSTFVDFKLDIVYSTRVGTVTLPISQHLVIAAPRRMLGKVVDVKFDKYKDKTAYLNLLLYVFNPGRLNITLNDINYGVKLSDAIDAKGTYPQIKLVPGEVTTATLPLEAAIDKPLGTLIDVARDNDTYSYKFTLNATVESAVPQFNGMELTIRKNGGTELFKEKHKEKSRKEKRKEKKKD